MRFAFDEYPVFLTLHEGNLRVRHVSPVCHVKSCVMVPGSVKLLPEDEGGGPHHLHSSFSLVLRVAMSVGSAESVVRGGM